MSERICISKLEAAQRQLNVAIRLLFADADPVAVHTLVGAASILFTDLIEKLAPHKSWDKLAQQANNLSPSEYFNIMRKAQNFLKHENTDHDTTLEFELVDTESIVFWALLNASELAPMSVEAQVFQLWYLASHAPSECADDSPFREAIQLFGDLRAMPRSDRLQIGARALSEQLSHGD
jgi:hypothetical protein